MQSNEGETSVKRILHYSANTDRDAKRVLISSDVHYTDLANYHVIFKMSKEERMQYWVDCVKAEHEKEPLDLLVINGDVSLDHWSAGGSANDGGTGTTGEFVAKYLSQLPEELPVFVMAGNHEQYSDADWFEITGNHRQGAMVFDNALFLFVDNYNANLNPTENNDGTCTQTDVDYINEMMELYPSCDVYLISHYFDITNESDTFKQLVAENDRIKGLFEGHTHNASTITLGEAWSGKTIAQTGTFANTDEDNFWGFRELIIASDSAYSKFIKIPTDASTDVTSTFERAYKIVYARSVEE